MKTKFIKFIPAQPTSAFDHKDGEIIYAKGVSITNNRLVPSPVAHKCCDFPMGYKPIGIHCGNVFVHYNDILYYTDRSCLDHDWATVCSGLVDLEYARRIDAFTSSGNLLMVATEDGIQQYEYLPSENRYVKLNSPMPELEFGMMQAGTLVSSLSLKVDAEKLGISSAGSGQSTTHTPAETSADYLQSIDEAIRGEYERAVYSQATSQGQFVSPFFVRYAYRLTDGSLTPPSMPVLMLPNVLPPCIGINAGMPDQDGMATVSVDLTGCRRHKLRMRMRTPRSRDMQRRIASVVVYVSQPVDTYLREGARTGFVTSYATMLAERDCGANARGRVQEPGARVFEGHYCLSDLVHNDVYLSDDDINRRVWYVQPNPNMHDRLLSESRFYKLAEFTGSLVESTRGGFVDVEIENTGDIPSLPLLEEERIVRGGDIRTAAITPFGANMIVSPYSISIPEPQPLHSLMCFPYSELHTGVVTTHVTVYATKNGKWCHRSNLCTSPPVNLTNFFPRYLAYPDRDADTMEIRQNDMVWTLPLRPHPTLDMAYWFAGTDSDYAPVPSDSASVPDVGDDDGFYDCRGWIMPSMTGSVTEYRLDAAIRVTADRINCVTPLSVAPQDALFGIYQLYAFSNHAVWLVSCDTKTASVSKAQIISDAGCSGNKAVCSTRRGIVYLHNSSIMLARGSRVERLQSLVPDDRMLRKILNAAGLRIQEIPDLSGADSIVRYGDSVICFAADTPGVAVCSLETDALSYADCNLTARMYNDGSVPGVYAAAEHRVVKMGSGTDDSLVMIVTAPFKADKDYKAGSLSGIALPGEGLEHLKTVLLGSNDTRSWHMVGVSRMGVDKIYDCQEHIFHAMVICGYITPASTLTAAKIILRA